MQQPKECIGNAQRDSAHLLEWSNHLLSQRGLVVNDLTSFSDGVMLIALLEILTNEKIPHTRNPKFISQKLDNLAVALKYMQEKMAIKVIGCNLSAIAEGNTNQILGMIFYLVLYSKSKEKPHMFRVPSETNLPHVSRAHRAQTISAGEIKKMSRHTFKIPSVQDIFTAFKPPFLREPKIQEIEKKEAAADHQSSKEIEVCLPVQQQPTSELETHNVEQQQPEQQLKQESVTNSEIVRVELDQQQVEAIKELLQVEEQALPHQETVTIDVKQEEIVANQEDAIIIEPKEPEKENQTQNSIHQQTALQSLISKFELNIESIKQEARSPDSNHGTPRQPKRIFENSEASSPEGSMRSLRSTYSFSSYSEDEVEEHRDRAARRIQRLVKQTSKSRKIEQEAQMRKQRKKIAQELVNTEFTYVSCLSDIINVFQKPMISRKLISKEEDYGIFSNIQDISNLHESLVSELGQRMSIWTENQKIGDVLCKMIPSLVINAKYINNFENSHLLLKQLVSKRHKLADFIGSCHSDKHGDGLNYLFSLLITPVQRIPRYELLLKDFLKYTPIGHGDFKDVKQAYDAIRDVANLLNEKKREEEEKHEAHRFQKRTFHTPTPCDFCDTIIWGIAKLGYTCDKCGYSAHAKCYHNISHVKNCLANKINKRHSLSLIKSKD